METTIMLGFAALLAGGIWVLSSILFRPGRQGGAHP